MTLEATTDSDVEAAVVLMIAAVDSNARAAVNLDVVVTVDLHVGAAVISNAVATRMWWRPLAQMW